MASQVFIIIIIFIYFPDGLDAWVYACFHYYLSSDMWIYVGVQWSPKMCFNKILVVMQSYGSMGHAACHRNYLWSE